MTQVWKDHRKRGNCNPTADKGCSLTLRQIKSKAGHTRVLSTVVQTKEKTSFNRSIVSLPQLPTDDDRSLVQSPTLKPNDTLGHRQLGERADDSRVTTDIKKSETNRHNTVVKTILFTAKSRDQVRQRREEKIKCPSPLFSSFYTPYSVLFSAFPFRKSCYSSLARSVYIPPLLIT